MEDLSSLKLIELKELAKEMDLKGVYNLKKSDLIDALEAAIKKEKEQKPQQKNMRDQHRKDTESVDGVLEEIDGKDFGFLRLDNFTSSDDDIYVSPVLIRKLGLVSGDKITGDVKRNQETDKFRALVYVHLVNGETPDKSIHRMRFDQMTPVHPYERIRLSHRFNEYSTRLIDLVAPVGKGQRGLIVSPPKAGKTVLLQNIARSIEENYPDITLMMLLIDERPEEVTEMKESIKSDVIYSTFDELPSNHIRIAEMALQRAQALASMKKDVVILMDSITRLARAYNIETAPSGRTLSGGIDPASLYMPKKFFGAARKLKEGGSITILATALVDTGSRMDDVIFEEFKGTGNMELILTRKFSEKRIFPAIDIAKSGTRREEKLLDSSELEFVYGLRRNLDEQHEAVILEDLLKLIRQTKNNEEFIAIANKQYEMRRP